MNNEIMEIPEINTGFVGRLIPTEEQKRLLNVNLNIARNAYNYARWKNLEEYKEANRLIDEYRKTLVEQKLSEDKIKELCDKYQKSVYKDLISSPYKLSVLYTAEVNSNPEKYKWMKEGDSFARCYCFSTSYRDAMRKFYANLDKMKANVAKKREKAKKRKDEGGKGKVYKFPKDYGFAQYKLKADSYNTELSINALDYENNKVRLCKIGWVQVTKNQPLPKYDFPTDKASNPRVIFDGIHYYISFSFHKDVEPFNTEKTDVIGVDLGLKNIAVLSTGEVIKNPANDERIIRLEERKKKFQKKLCWLRIHSPLCYKKPAKEAWKVSTKQTRMLNRLICKIQNKINHIKEYEKHTAAERIVRANPKGIVFETLNVTGMFQNKKLSSKLQQTGMADFKRVLKNHASKHGIPYMETSQWYASSQICSNCGHVDTGMKDLSRRTYTCPKCGLVIDRDVNAAKNLASMWENRSIS